MKNSNNGAGMKFKETVLLLVFAAIMLLGASAYYTQNWALTAVCTGLLAAGHIYCSRGKICLYDGKEHGLMTALLIFLAMFLMASRFYRIFNLPADYFSDEWTDISDINMKMNGLIPFFSHNARSGAAIPVIPHIIYAVLMALFREHIEVLRIVPALLSVLSCVLLYMLGKKMNGRRAGAGMAFAYAVSGWGLFTSHELLGNVFIVPLAALFLLLFLRYTASKKSSDLGWLLAVYFAGFFTYPSWALMTIYSAYLIFEFRKEIGMEATKVLAGAIAGLTVVAGAFFLINYSTIKWSAGLTVMAGGAVDMASNIANLAGFFTAPIKADFFTDKLPLFSFVELLFLIGGTVLCMVSIKDKSCRIVLAGFGISLLSLFISNGIGHQARHIMILPFAAMISGIFIGGLSARKYGLQAATIAVALFCGVYFYMYNGWNAQLGSNDVDIRMAKYVDANFSGNDTVFIHTTVPYGEYSAYYHSRKSYGRPAMEGASRVLFVSSTLLRGVVRSIFPWVNMKYFFDYSGGDKPAMVLYNLELNDPVLKQFFAGLDRDLTAVNVLMWQLKYQEAVDASENMCVASREPLAMLRNTFLRYQELKALEVLKKGDEMGRILMDPEKPMFLTSEWYLKLGEAFYAAGDMKDALDAVRTAVKLAPEWDVPRYYLDKVSSEIRSVPK